MAGGGGFLANPILGLLSGLMQTVGYNQQSEEARKESINQLGGGLNVSLGGANTGGSGFNMFGQDYQTPDIAGSMSNFTSSIADALKNNTQNADAWMQDLNKNTNAAYGSNLADQMGKFNAGAQNLQNMQQGGANALMGQYNQGAAGLLGQSQTGGQRVLDVFGQNDRAYQGNLGNQVGGLNSQAINRQNRGMDLLQGMGRQAERNINTQFDANRGNISQDLTSRGLGNSTVRESLMTGNERERANAQGNLQDQLRQQALSTYTGLSGDTLNQANQGVGLQNQAAASGLNRYTGIMEGNNANNQNLASGLFSGGQNLASGLQQQGLGVASSNFANGSNLYNGLANNALNANLSGQQNAVNNQISGQQGLTNWLTQAGGNMIGNMQNANSNALGVITGTNIGQPASPWNNIYALGQGIGSYQGTRDAMAAQQSANQMGMANPFNYINGGGGYNTSGGWSGNIGI